MKSFTTDPLDLMCFGMGSEFDAKSVQSFLHLKFDEVYRITEGIPTAVHLEDAMPDSLIESLQEIALNLGFGAYSNFFNAFNKMTKLTPEKYRLQNQPIK
jgi:AraC-like DNA-binding protein